MGDPTGLCLEAIGKRHPCHDPRVVARDESGPGFDTRTSWYRFGTDHCVHKLLIVLQRGRVGTRPDAWGSGIGRLGAERSQVQILPPR